MADEVAAGPESAGAEVMAAMLDLSSPQASYKAVIDGPGFVQPAEGLVLTFDRAMTEHVLRHHELFSSRVEMGLGNVRPLIPLNVDPPLHSKYRKLLDPLFAPKRMDEQEEDITRRVNALIDGFIDAGECNFTEEFAEMFPSSVFLGLMGLPEEELRMFLRLRDGILHPEKIDPDALVDSEKRAGGHGTGPARRSTTTSAAARRSSGREPADDIMSRFCRVRDRRRASVPEDILDICFLFLIAGLDTVSDSLTCFYAFLAQHPEHRRQIAEDPDCHRRGGRGAASLGVAGAVRRPACGDRGHRAAQRLARSSRAPPSSSCYGAANVDPSQCRACRSTCASTVSPTATSHSAAECTVASAPTWPGASCGSPCASGTGAYLITGSSRATRTSSTRPGSAT